MAVEHLNIEGLDDKQGAVLRSALEAFRLYGYRRTSMEDIAKGAGMSRAALYLHFRNKEDVFTHLTVLYFDRACADFEAALAQPGPLPDRLSAAFLAKGGEVMRLLFESPHGNELIEAKVSAAQEVVAEGSARMVASLAGWLTRMEADGQARLDVPADQAASVMIGALWGVKENVTDYDSYEAGVRLLGQMFGRSLAP